MHFFLTFVTDLLDFFFQVRGGIYRQNSLAFSETVRKLVSIYIYPEYNDQNILHDIALAKLDRPFDMDTFTTTVCLPNIGWGIDIGNFLNFPGFFLKL